MRATADSSGASTWSDRTLACWSINRRSRSPRAASAGESSRRAPPGPHRVAHLAVQRARSSRRWRRTSACGSTSSAVSTSCSATRWAAWRSWTSSSRQRSLARPFGLTVRRSSRRRRSWSSGESGDAAGHDPDRYPGTYRSFTAGPSRPRSESSAVGAAPAPSSGRRTRPGRTRAPRDRRARTAHGRSSTTSRMSSTAPLMPISSITRPPRAIRSAPRTSRGFSPRGEQDPVQGYRPDEQRRGHRRHEQGADVDPVWSSVICSNRWVKARVSRKANRNCTPVWATRSSCRSSSYRRSAFSSSVSPRSAGRTVVALGHRPGSACPGPRVPMPAGVIGTLDLAAPGAGLLAALLDEVLEPPEVALDAGA